MKEKKRTDRSISRVEATATFGKELDAELTQRYPIIADEQWDAISAIEDKSIPFFAFRVDRPTPFTRRLIEAALTRAADPTDPFAYSEHGAEHETFQEVVVTVIQAVREGKAVLGFATETDDYVAPSRYPSFIIKTTPYERATMRPRPYQFAFALRDRHTKDQRKMLRRATVQHGVPFGILGAIATGLDEKRVMEFFQDADLRSNIQRAYGETVRIPTSRRTGDYGTLAALVRTMMVRSARGIHLSFSPNSYLEALATLMGNGFLTADQAQAHQYQFGSVRDRVIAKAVFYPLAEEADRLADPEFVDPERSSYIDRTYGRCTTSRLITAYLAMVKEDTTIPVAL